MNGALLAGYVLLALAILGALLLQARLARRVHRIFRATPLIYSELGIPADIDLRPVLENPRLGYFAIVLTGTVLRVGFAVVTIAAFDAAQVRVAPVVAGGLVIALLLGVELIAGGWPSSDARLGRWLARALQGVGFLTRVVPGGSGGGPDRRDDALRDEVLTTVDGEELFDERQRRFLAGLLDLKRKTARHAMVPRSRMVTVQPDWSVGRAAKHLRDYPYARVPVSVRGARDIVGLVHAKDLLLLLHSGQEGAFVKTIMRDVTYIPATQRLDRLLVEFQSRRVHIAVVQDEYGSTCGLITLDDLLRQALTPKADV